MRASLSSGSTPPSLLSSTSDFRTAWRATSRCAAQPNPSPFAPFRAAGRGRAKSPHANFTRRIRATASSIRSTGTAPPSTRPLSAAMNSRHLSGTMNMSIPAFAAIATAAA